MGKPNEIPAVPKYIQEWESPFGPEARRFPLQVVGHHTLARVHSTMAGVDWLEEAFPQRVFVNPGGCRGARASRTATRSASFNDRGELTIRCRVTQRIMPGVVAIPQGAWWTPTRQGARPRRVGERADVGALDAAGVRQRAAHGHGGSVEGVTAGWRLATGGRPAACIDGRWIR